MGVGLYWDSDNQQSHNPCTPRYNGRPEWFDLLASLNRRWLYSRFLVKDLGLDFEYSTGTVVGLCGAAFEHEVQAWGGGIGCVTPISCGRLFGSDVK